MSRTLPENLDGIHSFETKQLYIQRSFHKRNSKVRLPFGNQMVFVTIRFRSRSNCFVCWFICKRIFRKLLTAIEIHPRADVLSMRWLKQQTRCLVYR